MHQVFRNIARSALYCMYRQKCIMFESSPDFSDNSKAVLDEMIKRKIYEKYRLIWIAYDNSSMPLNIANVSMVPFDDEGIKDYYHSAKAIISCNRILPSTFSGQFSMYLGHGLPFKDSRKNIQCPDNLKCFLSSSPYIENDSAININLCAGAKIVSLGYPRNDVFSLPKKDAKDIFFGDYSKIVAWYPTFRNHKCGTRNDGGNALPFIDTIENARILNDFAEKHDVLLVIKAHPVQKTEFIKDYGFDNLFFIDDNYLRDHGISNYEFLNISDALISDYSSVFLDFHLKDRPIALIWNDIAQYRINPGLVKNYNFLASGCQIVYTIEQLCEFIEDVVQGKDKYAKQRRIVRDYCHISVDGNNSKRVVDYIIKNANL